MRWQPQTKSKTFSLLKGDSYTVTELREGYDYGYKHYWIHGHIIDVIYCDNNRAVVGKGARGNQELIGELVQMYKLDGHNLDKILLMPPEGDPIYQPAVMYDSSDYKVMQIDELTVLEKVLQGKKYYNMKYTSGNKIEIKHDDICIVQLPMNQNLLNEMWNWRDEALKRFLESEFGKLLE